MPVFRQRRVVRLVRGAKAFLNLEAGITRAAVPDLTRTMGGAGSDARAGGGVAPGNMIWIFGTGRTGSTWLAAMMGELEGHSVWFEPRLAFFFDPQRFERYGGKHFILSPQYKETWLGSVRNFVLDGADARFPEVGGGYLVVKEPQGSMGAPILMEALPESRMILLIRDPRDVVASNLDAHRRESWTFDLMRKGGKERQETMADSKPDAFVKGQAERYMRDVGNAKQAYDAHRGRKVVVRYEELRSDALGTMKRMYAALGLEVDEGELAAAVERHAWEQIPEEEKGEGKFHRKAKPGGWQEDLTPGQAETVARITAPLLEEFYPAGSATQER